MSVLKILKSFHKNKSNCKACKCIKIRLHRDCFPRNFPKFVEWSFRYLWTAASVISLYIHRYIPVHFHLNNTKSYGCSQLYIIIGIYHITLLISLRFTCRLDIMHWCDPILSSYTDSPYCPSFRYFNMIL